MASRLNPYLQFDGDARAAREFYAEVLGGTPTFNTFGEYGSVSVPLEKQMWGDEFGMCTDRFGIVWLVDIAGASAT